MKSKVNLHKKRKFFTFIQLKQLNITVFRYRLHHKKTKKSYESK